MMKKGKTVDPLRTTELGENILKTQNTMLATKVDQLKQELFNIKSVLDGPLTECHVDDELLYYKKLCTQLQRRVRIITAYNEESINKKCDEADDETFECLCGTPQIQAVKYKMINDNPPQQIQQDKEGIQDNQQQQLQQIELKQIMNEHAEQNAQLLQQIEDLKLTSKLPEEQFFQTPLFAELVQQNNYLTSLIFSVEDQLIQAQLENKDLLEKHLLQITQLQQECEIKIKDAMIEQEPIKIEIKQEDQHENLIIEQLRKQCEGFQKVIDDLKSELKQSRDRCKDIENQLFETINHKQILNNQIVEQKQIISEYKLKLKEEKFEQMTLRYEKHKQLLFEIEQEYVNHKSTEFIQKFREFVGYVKNRDDKVKGLEQIIDQKVQDMNGVKKQMQSLINELDYNSNTYNSIQGTNQNLNKMLNEAQTNLSRAMGEKLEERIKFENEKQQFLIKIQSSDEAIKQLLIQNDQYRKSIQQFENERHSSKEAIRQLSKQETDNKSKLLQKEQDLFRAWEESKILTEREKLSESINTKYLKKAEKAKAKLKHLKQQMDSKDGDNELWNSMKMMVNCQQCKKSIKSQILMKCLHMFCKACIDENQKNRFRQCPVCRTKYGNEDVKPIKLN